MSEKQALPQGLTSLAPRWAPQRLLALKRGQWIREHGLHRVQEATVGADHRLIHPGHGPPVRAWRRAAALTL